MDTKAVVRAMDSPEDEDGQVETEEALLRPEEITVLEHSSPAIIARQNVMNPQAMRPLLPSNFQMAFLSNPKAKRDITQQRFKDHQLPYLDHKQLLPSRASAPAFFLLQHRNRNCHLLLL